MDNLAYMRSVVHHVTGNYVAIAVLCSAAERREEGRGTRKDNTISLIRQKWAAAAGGTNKVSSGAAAAAAAVVKEVCPTHTRSPQSSSL